jgi:hypothetical protein
MDHAIQWLGKVCRSVFRMWYIQRDATRAAMTFRVVLVVKVQAVFGLHYVQLVEPLLLH